MAFTVATTGNSIFKKPAQIQRILRGNTRVAMNIHESATKPHIPVATGATLRSLDSRLTSLGYKLSSINWEGPYPTGADSRYVYRNSAVLENRNKFEWFDKGYDDSEDEIILAIIRGL